MVSEGDEHLAGVAVGGVGRVMDRTSVSTALAFMRAGRSAPTSGRCRLTSPPAAHLVDGRVTAPPQKGAAQFRDPGVVFTDTPLVDYLIPIRDLTGSFAR